MLELPFFKELENAQNILLAGAGGGFDIFSGLPLNFDLEAGGKQVHLAHRYFLIRESALAWCMAAGIFPVQLGESFCQKTADAGNDLNIGPFTIKENHLGRRFSFTKYFSIII